MPHVEKRITSMDLWSLLWLQLQVSNKYVKLNNNLVIIKLL